MSWHMPKTIRDYEFGEVASALQKSIRRGVEDEALYWAAELDRSGYQAYLWYRLLIIASEDVGIAEAPPFFCEIWALRQAAEQVAKKKHGHKPERMFLAHAVMRLCRARKSEIVGEALYCHWEIDDKLYEIPDYALDPHTARGREMGRKFPEWNDITYHVENENTELGREIYKVRSEEIEAEKMAKIRVTKATDLAQQTDKETDAQLLGGGFDAGITRHTPRPDKTIAERNADSWREYEARKRDP